MIIRAAKNKKGVGRVALDSLDGLDCLPPLAGQVECLEGFDCYFLANVDMFRY